MAFLIPIWPLINDWLMYVYKNSLGFLEHLDNMLVFWTFLAIGVGSGGFLIVTMVMGEVGDVLGDLFGDIGHDFGGADHDVGGADHDVGHDAGHHGGEHAAHESFSDAANMPHPSFLSLRFLLAFMSGFGVTGAIATHLGQSVLPSSAYGVGTGLVMWIVVYGFVSILSSQQASINVTEADFVGKEAHVTLEIPAGGCGQVSMQIGESTFTKIAKTADGSSVPENARVAITGIVGPVALVEKKT